MVQGAYSTGGHVKILFWAGAVILILGIVSLLVPIPHQENTGFKAGDINIGVQTRHDEKVSPIVSAVLIAGGIGMMMAGGRGKQ